MPKPSEMKTYINDVFTILSRQGAWQAMNVIVSASDVTADANGKKIVPAGTILGTADAESTIQRGKAKAKPANDATAEGLTMNAVDVTHGDMEVSMLYMGTVGLDRIPMEPVADAYAALSRITFTAD